MLTTYTLSVAEDALANLDKATIDYEFELSLRGLRQVLPGIISTALNTIDQQIAHGIAEGQRIAREEVSRRGARYCSDNIPSMVDGIVTPYKNALIRMRNAVNNANDNDQTRSELEASLRQLASLNRVNKSVNATVRWGIFPLYCNTTFTSNRSVSLNFEVLSNTQVMQLTTAANNVKFISETSDIRINAQTIVDAIPTQEILDRLNEIKQNVANQVETYSNFQGVGFIKNHNTEEFTFFIEKGSERTSVASFDPFNPDAIINILVPGLQQK